MLLRGDSDSLEIVALRRSNTETDDYWDGNWLVSEVRIEVRGFTARFHTNLRVDELRRWHETLRPLQSGSTRRAEIGAMEEGLTLSFEVKPTGAVNCIGTAKNHTGASLEFRMGADLPALEVFLSGLQETLRSYPLVGTSD